MSSMDGWEHCGGKRRRLRDEGSSEPILQREYTHLVADLFAISIVIYIYTICLTRIYCPSPMETRLPLFDVTNTVDSRVAKRTRTTTTNTSETGCVNVT